MWGKKKNKYNAVKVFQHGRNWASKLELSVYEMLLMMERGGKFKDIKCQVKVRFHTYKYGLTNIIPDFSAYDCEEKQTVFIEAKGFPTNSFLRKKRAWAINGPGILYIYGGSWRFPKLMETIIPKGEKLE